MTACCCRLTHPAKTRTRKASGGGSESTAPSVRREVDAVQGAANLDSCAIKVGRLPSRQASHSCLEHADYRAIQPGLSFRTGRDSVAVDASGAVIVAGQVDGVVTAAKFSADGTMLWRRIIGPGWSPVVAVHPDGEYVVLTNYALSRLDQDGNVFWQRPFQDSFAFGYVAFDASGNIIVAWGVGDFVVTKFAPDGQELWRRRIDVLDD